MSNAQSESAAGPVARASFGVAVSATVAVCGRAATALSSGVPSSPIHAISARSTRTSRPSSTASRIASRRPRSAVSPSCSDARPSSSTCASPAPGPPRLPRSTRTLRTSMRGRSPSVSTTGPSTRIGNPTTAVAARSMRGIRNPIGTRTGSSTRTTASTSSAATVSPARATNRASRRGALAAEAGGSTHQVYGRGRLLHVGRPPGWGCARGLYSGGSVGYGPRPRILPAPMSNNFADRRLTRKQREQVFRVNLVLDAAHQVFMERPFGQVTVEDIARRAELSVGTLYNLFSSKEQIYKNVVSRQQDGFFERLEERFAQTSVLIEQVHAMIREYFDLFSYNLRVWRFHVYATAGLGSDVRNELHAEVHESTKIFMQHLTQVCQAGIDAGVFAAGMPPHLLAVSLHSVPHSFLGVIFERDKGEVHDL
ncbi:MAG: TetR family transcriptional regulator, partial [Myxococcales bacterium]